MKVQQHEKSSIGKPAASAAASTCTQLVLTLLCLLLCHFLMCDTNNTAQLKQKYEMLKKDYDDFKKLHASAAPAREKEHDTAQVQTPPKERERDRDRERERQAASERPTRRQYATFTDAPPSTPHTPCATIPPTSLSHNPPTHTSHTHSQLFPYSRTLTPRLSRDLPQTPRSRDILTRAKDMVSPGRGGSVESRRDGLETRRLVEIVKVSFLLNFAMCICGNFPFSYPHPQSHFGEFLAE